MVAWPVRAWAVGRSRPDRPAAPDSSRNRVTRARLRSAAVRRRSAMSGATARAARQASRSTWNQVLPLRSPRMRASARAASSSSRGSKVRTMSLALGLVRVPSARRRPMPGSRVPRVQARRGEVPGGDRAHGEGAGDLVVEVVVPPVGQVGAAAGQRPPWASSRVMARRAPRPPAAAQDSIAVHCRAIPTSGPRPRRRRAPRARRRPPARSRARPTARRRPSGRRARTRRAARAGPRPGRASLPGPGSSPACHPMSPPRSIVHSI